MRRLLILLMAFLMLTGCASPEKGYDPEPAALCLEQPYVAEPAEPRVVERACVPLREMDYVRPDGDTLLADLNVLYARWLAAGGMGERSVLMTRINALLLDFMTLYSLCDLRTAGDTFNQELQDELRYMDDLRRQLSDTSRCFYERLLEPENEALRQELGSDQTLAGVERSVRLSSDATARLREEEDALERRYTVSAASAVYVDASDLCRRYYEDWSTLFLRLCQNRYQQAVALGYDSFAGLGFERMGREGYTPEDVERFREAVKSCITPVCSAWFADAAGRHGLETPEFYLLGSLVETPEITLDPAALLDTFRRVYTEMSPETGACVSYLLDYDLCDLLPSASKCQGGFQTYLYSYASPCIFGSFTGGAQDVSLFSHEFGHAFASWVTVDPDPARFRDNAPSMDSREVQSSGMTLLTTRWYPELFGADAQSFEAADVLEQYLLILECCMYDEWQQEIYTRWPEIAAMEDPAAELDAVAARLRREYYGDLSYRCVEPYGEGKMWVASAHLFETPFYMIDYALAAAASLQLYTVSRSDWDRAFDIYTAMLAAAPDSDFSAMLAAGGLESPFEPDTIARLGRTMNALRGTSGSEKAGSAA